MNGEKKKFAKGICFSKLFWIFVIGCVFGTYYEQILTLIQSFLRDGSVIWESRRGVIYGPFSPIYGFGAVMLTYVLAKQKLPWYRTFIYGAILGGVIEYGIGFLQETFIGTVSWDYSNKFLNIHGRTTVPFMFFWGVLAVTYIEFIYPRISNFIESLPIHKAQMLTNVMVVFMCLNMFVSWTALFRQTLRRNHIEPYTIVGKFYDKYYTDEYLSKYFPNMIATDVEGGNYEHYFLYQHNQYFMYCDWSYQINDCYYKRKTKSITSFKKSKEQSYHCFFDPCKR